MSKLPWEAKLALVLVTITVTVYTLKTLFIGNMSGTAEYIFNSLGFLPINVLLVTVVLNKLLAMRSQREKMEKLNMVIGTFFSETGTGLLTYLSEYDPTLDQIRGKLSLSVATGEEDFKKIRADLKAHPFEVTAATIDLPAVQSYLRGRRDFLLRLLENPVLLEHQRFTELLQAVFHLTEELDRRGDCTNLPESDRAHLAGDINRVYGLLVYQWLDYMDYLWRRYPYMFSLAVRTNPFDETASPVVTA